MTTRRGMDPLRGAGLGMGAGVGAGLRQALPEWWPVMLGLALLFG
ncbi:exosortase B, partial [Acinetobacter baumannii]|nr:exosortase B [Acinetobacter baumannii]